MQQLLKTCYKENESKYLYISYNIVQKLLLYFGLNNIKINFTYFHSFNVAAKNLKLFMRFIFVT